MEEQIKLFDVDEQPIIIKFRSKYQKWKFENGYTKADECSDIRCENCKYLFKRIYSRTHYKCQLLGFSSSPATDVRLSCTCKNFECDIKE